MHCKLFLNSELSVNSEVGREMKKYLAGVSQITEKMNHVVSLQQNSLAKLFRPTLL